MILTGFERLVVSFDVDNDLLEERPNQIKIRIQALNRSY